MNNLVPLRKSVFDSFFDDIFETPSSTLSGIYTEIGEDLTKLAIEVPGMTKEDITLNIENNILIITGESEILGSKKTIKRSLTLPKTVDSEKIEAKVTNGILNVVLPKAESSKKRQILIT